MIELSDLQLAALAGFGGGVMLGLAARVGRFCMMGAVEDAVYGGDLGRMRMLAMAAAMAIAGSFGLIEAGLLDPDATRYFRGPWSPSGSVVGGLMFGMGMSLVGTCAFGALARAGGGDLRGLVMAVVVGIAALATAGGPLQPLRLALEHPIPETENVAGQGLAHLAGAAFGLPPVLLAFAVAAALAGWALRDRRFRRAGGHLIWSLLAGAAIVSAWAATAWLARSGFGAVEVESFSFVAPTGQSSHLPDDGSNHRAGFRRRRRRRRAGRSRARLDRQGGVQVGSL